MKRPVHTDDAPAAVGAYSQATTTDNLVFTAGQIALTPDGAMRDDASVAALSKGAAVEIEAVAVK